MDAAESLRLVREAYAERGQVTIPADAQLTPAVTTLLREYCRSRGVADEAWSAIELAVTEGVNNSIEHGCQNDAGRKVTVSWSWHGTDLEVQVVDPGSFQPVQTVAQLPEDPLAEGGRGLFLMQALMDEIEHDIAPGGHRLTMRKHLGPARASADMLAAIGEMEGTLDAMAEDLSAHYENLSALFWFAELLATVPSFADFAARALERLVTLAQADEAVFFLYDESAAGSLEVCGAHRLDGTPRTAPLDAAAPWAEPAAFREHQERTIEALAQLAEGDPLRRSSGNAFLCPVFFQDRAQGLLTLRREKTEPYFTAGQLSLTRTVSDFLGIARATSALQEQRAAQERTMRELEIASGIQQSLLPTAFPETERLSVFGVCQNALRVGGDYFDAIRLKQGGLLLVVSDVMGKGVPAALLATIFRTTIHARLDLATNPAELMFRVNRQLRSDVGHLDIFITAQFAFLPEDGGPARIADAGHCPVIHHVAATGGVEWHKGEGTPLGIFDAMEFPEASFEFAPGDTLLMLTDGAYEVEDPRGELLGMDGLSNLVRAADLSSAQSAVMSTLKAIKDYTQNAPPPDDLTLLAAKVR